VIGFGAPGFLLAGALAALAVAALHLLVRRPPQRAPLPTARFLAAAPRAAVRLRRTPQDVLLLAVRFLFALIFAAAFARPVWHAQRDDVARIVMLDRGAGMGSAWSAAVDSARVRASSTAALLIFDSAATWVRGSALDAAFFDSLVAAIPGAAEADYRAAFRALASAGRVLPAGAYRGTLITVPRWGAWRAGTATSRRAVWPGALELVTPSASAAAAAAAERRGMRVAAAPGSALRDAVEALGWEAVDTSAVDTNVVRFVRADERAGAASRRAELADVVFRGGWTASAARPRVQADLGAAAGDAVAAFRDGAAAAVATVAATGCTVTTSFTLDAEPLITTPDYPELVRRLVEACHSGTSGELVAPLDSGGVALLRGAGSASADVDPAELPGGAPGRSLAQPLLALALLLALAEWPLRLRRVREETA
jgi:hypothetical protein